MILLVLVILFVVLFFNFIGGIVDFGLGGRVKVPIWTWSACGCAGAAPSCRSSRRKGRHGRVHRQA